jgi:SAM-dependent methyltransferase
LTERTPTREWFRDWFGEEYLALYPHRDEREAQQAVDLFRTVAPSLRGRVLDLACGAGRHLRGLRGAGLDAVGLDLSGVLLRSARRDGPVDPLVRADMRRLPLAGASFQGLTSFFTSFGYFADAADDRRVLDEMARVLVPGGAFMLDFLNASRVRRELVPEDCREVDGSFVSQVREIVDDMVVKRIAIEPADGGAVRQFEERVRMYSCQEMVSLLADAGLVTEDRFGDYGGRQFDPDAPRLILAGRKVQGGDRP